MGEDVERQPLLNQERQPPQNPEYGNIILDFFNIRILDPLARPSILILD